jgi:predicted chitinase
MADACVKFGTPVCPVPVIENDKITDIYFAKKVLTPAFEDTKEVVEAKKGDTEKSIKARFIKAHNLKKDAISGYAPEKPFTKALGKENVTITYRKKIADTVSYEKITHTKIKQKVWVVAICNIFEQEGKLTVEIMENKQTYADAIYDNPIKFLVGDAEKAKLEFDLAKDKTVSPNIFAKEITLQPKSKDDVKKLMDKFAKRKDKNAFLYIKGEIKETQKITFLSYLPNQKENIEYLNSDNGRLEISGAPCYCGVDFTVEEIKSFYNTKGKDRVLFSHKDCPVPKDKRNYKDFTAELNGAMKEYDINTCIRKAHFLAQIEAETFFATSLEYADGWDYDYTTHLDNYNNYELYRKHKKEKINPYEIYNTKPIKRSHDRYSECINHGHNVKGYGPKYKGSGLIQLTWRDTHLSYLTYKGKANLIDTDYPIASDLNLVCDSAAWYWKNRSVWGNLNNHADNDDLIYVSLGVNGGDNGFDHRKSNLKKILNTLTVKDSCINLNIGDKELGVYKWETSHLKNHAIGKNKKTIFKKHDD